MTKITRRDPPNAGLWLDIAAKQPLPGPPPFVCPKCEDSCYGLIENDYQDNAEMCWRCYLIDINKHDGKPPASPPRAEEDDHHMTEEWEAPAQPDSPVDDYTYETFDD